MPTPAPSAGTAFPARRLTLRGVPVFELSLWRGTCPPLFERLSEPDRADLELANERLNVGLTAVDGDVLRAYGEVLPESQYSALLLDAAPRLVKPGGTFDYFSNEVVATWGVDPLLGSPEDPATPYYRSFETPVGPGQHLHEFIVPMVPPSWNDGARVAEYSEAWSPVSSALPTAVAYSILDVVEPAMDDGEDLYQHWVLTHFLLDGHHKVEAAAADGRPVRLLSLVDERISMAAPDDLVTLVGARSQPRQARR